MKPRWPPLPVSVRSWLASHVGVFKGQNTSLPKNVCGRLGPDDLTEKQWKTGDCDQSKLKHDILSNLLNKERRRWEHAAPGVLYSYFILILLLYSLKISHRRNVIFHQSNFRTVWRNKFKLFTRILGEIFSIMAYKRGWREWRFLNYIWGVFCLY